MPNRSVGNSRFFYWAGLILGCGLFACPVPARADFYTENAILSNMIYRSMNRGFTVQFNDPGHRGFGSQDHLAWVPGTDAEGRYVDVILEDVPMPVFDYTSSTDGWIRIHLDSTPPRATLVAYGGCGEHNCVLYDGKPLFGQRDTGPIDPPSWSDPTSIGMYPTAPFGNWGYYGYLGYDTRKVGMEVLLPEPATLALLWAAFLPLLRRRRT